MRPIVKRGELVLDFDVIDGWDKELERMNDALLVPRFFYSAARIHASLFASTI